MPDAIVIDTSALIALEKLGLLSLLCNIYTEVIVPESVIKEFGDISLPCISVKKVESNLVKLLVTDLNLGEGEAEAIALANESELRLMIDEVKARRIAEDMGLKITGTIGFLIKAQKFGLIKSAYEKVKELKEKGFYIADNLIEEIKNLS